MDIEIADAYGHIVPRLEHANGRPKIDVLTIERVSRGMSCTEHETGRITIFEPLAAVHTGLVLIVGGINDLNSRCRSACTHAAFIACTVEQLIKDTRCGRLRLP